MHPCVIAEVYDAMFDITAVNIWQAELDDPASWPLLACLLLYLLMYDIIHPLHVAYHNTHIQRSFFFPEIKRLFLHEENSRNEYTLDTGPLLPGEVGQASVPMYYIYSCTVSEIRFFMSQSH